MNNEEINRICWRIKIQILAMQMDDYLIAQTQQERDTWKTRMLDTLCRINQQAQLFNPSELPKDLRPASHARVVLGANWLDGLTEQLKQVFLSVPAAVTARGIE